MKKFSSSLLISALLIVATLSQVAAFTTSGHLLESSRTGNTNNGMPIRIVKPIVLYASSEDSVTTLSESDQTLLGTIGTLAAMVTLYSEFTLKTTGCGLPAGPFGLVGLVEGLSYLGVTGLSVYSIVTKVKTGSGLPAGPSGLLGAAEGLSFLTIFVGLVVLGLQVTDYGYIPNAVPMEGGMCN